MARVEAVATCQRDGVEVRVEFRDRRAGGGMDERIAIRVNRGMGEDAIIGKARCKTLKALWREAMGQAAGPVGAEDDEPIDATAERTTVTVEADHAALEEFRAAVAKAESIKAVGELHPQFLALPEADKPAARDAVAARKADLRAASDGAMGDRP